MFKVKQNDLFAKNMNQGELYQVYLKFKAKKEMDKFLNKINNMKLKIKKNDLFSKNMSQQELHQTWVKIKAKKEMDKFLNKLITKNGTTKYQYEDR